MYLLEDFAGLFLWNGVGNELPDSLDAFLSVMGVLAPTLIGSVAAAKTAVLTVQSTVRANLMSNNFEGMTFFSYGGHSLAGDLLGIVEAFWAVAFFVLAATFAYLPYDLAYAIDRQFATKGDASLGFTHLTYGLGLAVAIEFAYLCLEQSASTLLGFFDIHGEARQNPESTYAELFGNSPTFHNQIAVFFDLAHHSIVLLFYYAIAATLSAGSFYYVNKSIEAAS